MNTYTLPTPEADPVIVVGPDVVVVSEFWSIVADTCSPLTISVPVVSVWVYKGPISSSMIVTEWVPGETEGIITDQRPFTTVICALLGPPSALSIATSSAY